MENRIERALASGRQAGADALLITSYENARYLTGFTGSNVTAFISDNRRVLITDQRYGDQAKAQSPGWDVIVHGPGRDRASGEIVAGLSASSVAFEDVSLTAARYLLMTELMPLATWVPLGDQLVRNRSIKDADEIQTIRRSVAAAEAGFSTALSTLVPGATEHDVAVELEYRMGRAGSEGVAFPSIVAAGPNSALPHAEPGANRIAEDDLVTIDWGAVVDGYHSDLTRVVRLGSPDPEWSRLLALTLNASSAAMEALRVGVTGNDVDAAARAVFEAAGLEPRSLRGLGHGVGLEIHENPRIVMESEEVLEAGMVFTIEPGLYVPGLGGVRVENTVLLTQSGPEILSGTLPLVIEKREE